MKVRVDIWDTPEIIKERLSTRLTDSLRARSEQERQWTRNEHAVYGVEGINSRQASDPQFFTSFDSKDEPMCFGTAQMMRNVRYIHSQMSSNPASTIATPASTDEADKQAALSADKLAHHLRHRLDMQETQDQGNLGGLLYGTGFTKVSYDESAGDILEFDQESGKVVMSGELSFTAPLTWDVYPDPHVSEWKKVRWVFERVLIPLDQALSQYPHAADAIKGSLYGTQGPNTGADNSNNYGKIAELFEYHEVGLPENGFAGRWCLTTNKGVPLTPVELNPMRFISAVAERKLRESMKGAPSDVIQAKVDKLPQKAINPFSIITDIDVPGTYWGKSFVEYATPGQSMINRIDEATMEAVELHNVARLVVPDDGEHQEDSLTDSSVDLVKVDFGGATPFFIKPPAPMMDAQTMRSRGEASVDMSSGLNESSFGVQSRETAAAAMQTASNNANLVRHRLFVKYKKSVKESFTKLLLLVRKHWTTDRTIMVMGQENRLEAHVYQHSDIAGGFEFTIDYGTSFALDPLIRQDQITRLMPLFQQAGLPMSPLIASMRLSDLPGIQDMSDMARRRVMEVFEIIKETGMTVNPKKYQRHTEMIAAASNYFMTAEFSSLDTEIQELMEAYVDQMVEMEAAKQPAAPALPPGLPQV